MTETVTPSKYHQPCWELTLKPDTPQEQRYLVWGPGEIKHDGHATGERRDHWQSSWQANYGGTGGGTSGRTLEGVLGIFPAQVAAAFREAIGDQA